MPSSPGYKRDLKREYETAKARGENGTGHNSDNAKRHRLRRQMVKEGKVRTNDGKDVDHTRPLSKGGANTTDNARVRTPGQNRSFPRNSDGSMKANHPKGTRRSK